MLKLNPLKMALVNLEQAKILKEAEKKS